MSISDQALLVFGQNGGPQKKLNDYDSRLGRLQVDLKRDPAHLAIVDNVIAGTALVSSTTFGAKVREDLLTVPHNLPFNPEALLYIYTKSYGGSTVDARAGSYGGNILFLSGSSGLVEDTIRMEVHDGNLYIYHQVQDLGYFAINGTTYTSDAPKWLLRLKYYIFSNDSHVTSYSDAAIVG